MDKNLIEKYKIENSEFFENGCYTIGNCMYCKNYNILNEIDGCNVPDCCTWKVCFHEKPCNFKCEGCLKISHDYEEMWKIERKKIIQIQNNDFYCDECKNYFPNFLSDLDLKKVNNYTNFECKQCKKNENDYTKMWTSNKRIEYVNDFYCDECKNKYFDDDNWKIKRIHNYHVSAAYKYDD